MNNKKSVFFVIVGLLGAVAIFYSQKTLRTSDQSVEVSAPIKPAEGNLSDTNEAVSPTVRATPQAEIKPASAVEQKTSSALDQRLEKLKNVIRKIVEYWQECESPNYIRWAVKIKYKIEWLHTKKVGMM